jgi:hypothetical protein
LEGWCKLTGTELYDFKGQQKILRENLKCAE